MWWIDYSRHSKQCTSNKRCRILSCQKAIHRIWQCTIWVNNQPVESFLKANTYSYVLIKLNILFVFVHWLCNIEIEIKICRQILVIVAEPFRLSWCFSEFPIRDTIYRYVRVVHQQNLSIKTLSLIITYIYYCTCTIMNINISINVCRQLNHTFLIINPREWVCAAIQCILYRIYIALLFFA